MSLAETFRPRAFDPKLALRTWQREWTVYKHIWKATVVANVADPVIYLLALGFGLGAYVTGITYQGAGIGYLQFIAPGLVASSTMMAATFEVAWNSWMRMHSDGVYDAMLTTPAEIEDVVVGQLCWATTRAAMYATVMLAILVPIGLVRSPLVVLVPLVAALGGYLFATIGLSYTGSLSSMDQITYYFTLFVTPQFLFSGIFFPLDRLPPIVQNVAWLTPLFHLVRVIRALVLGAVGPPVVVSLAWMVVAVLVLYAVPINVIEDKLVQ